MPNPWDRYAEQKKKGNPWDRYAQSTPSADITSNPKGEGLYRMGSYDFDQGNVSKPEIQVPYSNIGAAREAGYNLHPDEQERYHKDRINEGQGPTLWERTKAGVSKALEPSKGIVGTIPIVPGLDVNRAKAAARTVLSTPEYLGQLLWTAKGVLVGDPTVNPNDLIDLIDPYQMPPQIYHQFQSDRKQYGDRIATQNLTGTLEGLGIVAAVTHGISKRLPNPTIDVEHPIADLKAKTAGLPEQVRGEIRELAGAWKNTRDVVEKFGTESEKMREDNVKINKDRLDQLKKEHEERLKVLEQNKDKIQNYEEAVKNTKAQNDIDYRREVERQKLEGEHKSASIQLKNKVQAAYKKATTAYNATWNTWRGMVKGVSVKMTPVIDTIKAQESGMNPQQVSIFRDILRETEPSEATLSGIQLREKLSMDAFGKTYDNLTPGEKTVMDIDVAQRGIDLSDPGLTEVPASRLHGWKSQLERAVRSTQDGVVRYAVGKVLQSVRALEEQASDTVPGAKKQLLAARKITGPYFDAFFKSPEDVPKAAGQMLREQTPEQVKAEAQQDRVDRIAAYDPSIKSLANHIDNLKAALKNPELNKGKTAKDLTPLPKEPTVGDGLKPKPEPKPLKDFAKEPEVPDLQKENMRFIADKLRWYGHVGSWVLRLVVGGGLKVLSHGSVPEFGGELAIGQYGVTVLTRALRSPSVLEWLARPSAEDMNMISHLPPEDAAKLRQVLGKLAEVDEQRPSNKPKPTIAPAMAAWLAGGAASQKGEKANPTDLKKQAEDLQNSFHRAGMAQHPAQPAAPGPQSFLRPTHRFDETSGNIVAIV